MRSAALAFGDRLRAAAEALGIAIDDDAVARLVAYQTLLRTWTRHQRLVADSRPEVTVSAHFADSLALLRIVDRPMGGPLVDVGSGAGFPGMVLAAARPRWPVVLVEPRKRRHSFLMRLVVALGLDRVTVLPRRVETLPDAMAGVAVSRATFPVPVWIEVGARLVRDGGRVVVTTARGLDTAALRAAEAAGLDVAAEDRIVLPGSGAARVNVSLHRAGRAPTQTAGRTPPG